MEDNFVIREDTQYEGGNALTPSQCRKKVSFHSRDVCI